MMMPRLWVGLVLAAGGLAGTLLRYAIDGCVYRFVAPVFPWGTFVVNIIGSFGIGFLWQIFENAAVAPYLKTLLMIGVLGAFTTFSTFMLETLQLLRDGEYKLAVLNMVLSNGLGLLTAFLGFVAARKLGDL